MADIKSGIVLYPEGEVAPNIARQLGYVTNAHEEDGEVQGGTVHAISYDPELVIEGLRLYYDNDDLSGFFMPPMYRDGADSSLDRIRRELGEVPMNDLVSQSFGSADDPYILDGRRIDIIGPKITPANGLALRGIGRYMNKYVANYRSEFERSAHPWVQTESGFDVPVESSNLSLQDFRTQHFRGARGYLPERRVMPSSHTFDAYVGESLVAKIQSMDRLVTETGSLRIDETIRDSKMVLDIKFKLPASQEVLAAMQAKREELAAMDRQHNIDYSGDEFGLRDDGHWDLFGDYKPEPVSRQPVGDIAAIIDPLDDPAYQERLN